MALERGKVKVEGLRELDRALRKLGAKTAGRSLRSALIRASTPMLQAAKANALAIKDSGALHAAMGRWSRIGKEARVGEPDGRARVNRRAVSTYIGPKVKSVKGLALYRRTHPGSKLKGLVHGHLAEWGSKHFPGTRYMTRAFDANKVKTVKRFKPALKKIIDSVREKRRAIG